MLAYYNGKILPLENIQISPFDRGLMFGDGVYEVIRCYPKKIFLFDAHIKRLKESLRKTNITEPNLSNLENVILQLLEQNNLSNEYAAAYIQITRGTQFPRRHAYADSITPNIFIYVEAFPPKHDELTKGIKAGLEEDIRWMRCDIKSTLLLPNVLSQRKAKDEGYSEIIWHRNGIITEGTHTNIFFVKDGVVVTPFLNNFILPGITRKQVLNLCSENQIASDERSISINELYNFDEIFITSTINEITPVIEFDGKLINRGVPGEITMMLQKEYQKLYI
ncbi:MAG: aminotransferase class IV [Bacteroidota bacterium]